MVGNSSWIYQGRQSHGWFGHGTGPGHEANEPVLSPLAASIEQRAHDLGHTLVAGLPRSRRHHDAAQLGTDDHARLTRLLTAIARAWPLGTSAVARQVLGKDADASGIASFVHAAGLLRTPGQAADLRAATDALGQAVQDIGLDHFKTFLRRADDHFSTQGGLLTLVRDGSQIGPPVEESPIGVSPFSAARASITRATILALAAEALSALTRWAQRTDLEETIQRFGLDGGKPEDVAAAGAFLWAERYGPYVFPQMPLNGPGMVSTAELFMRIALADPELFARAMRQDPDAQRTISAVMSAPVPGSGIETHNDEERAMVAQMIRSGTSAAEIQTVLDFYRQKGRRPNTRERRNLPGVAMISTSLPRANGQWLSEGLKREDGALIPGQVADLLIGRRFSNFDAFRAAFWTAVANDAELSSSLIDRNLSLVQGANAPYSPQREQVTVLKTGQPSSRPWEIHHTPELQDGGPVYDLSKMRVVTPRQHTKLGANRDRN